MKNAETIGLWKYNSTTGYWRLQRECLRSEANQWLSIFQADEPRAEFKLSVRQPKASPNRKSNPVPPSSRAGMRSATRTQIQKAADLYQRFSGHDAEEIGRIKIPNLPAVGIAIGTCDGILYTTVRDGVTEKYIHKFHKRDCPLFVVSPDGKSLFLLGGVYNFTERGIVDRSDK